MTRDDERFEAAFAATMGEEGGWCDIPDDPGGETYRGVSRVYHPGWPGWAIVDRHKADPDRFPTSLAEDQELQGHVRAFYHTEFWSNVGFAGIENTLVQMKLFDMAVNCGPAEAVRHAQQAVNYLVRRPMEVCEDGRLGPKTLAAINAQNPHDLLLALRGYHFLHYHNLVASSRTRFETFARGWLRRALERP